MMRIGLVTAFMCSVAACGHHGSGDDVDETRATLTIDPPTAELLILNGVDAHQGYTATLTFPDGKITDVTDSTTFAIEESFGKFTASDLAVSTAGKTIVYGSYTDKTASAQVIVRLKDLRVDPSLPANTPDLFVGTEDAALAPTVVYPALDVIAPRNLGDFETHWTDRHGNNVFEISLKTEFSDVRVYVPGGNGVAAAGPMASWSSFSAAEWLDAVGLETSVTYQVRGANTARPGPVGAAPPRMVYLTNEPMEGGLYYWAAASTGGGAYGIFRHDMSKPGQPAEEYMTTNQTNGRCVACHVLSRDGTRLAVTYDGGNGPATLVDVATKAAQGGSNQWNFGTFTPDGNELITAAQGAIQVRQYANQAVITTMPSTGWGTHPDLSADGKKLVYVRTNAAAADWSFTSGALVTRTYDQSTHTFGAEMPLVSGGGDNYYPSWSPDGEWVLFNRSPSNANAYNATDATLWVVKADRTQPPIQLTVANDGTALTNSWGRWAPFAQTYKSGEKLFWITVSSKRNFGTRLFGAGRPQLWMTPFFPARATAQTDPSAPAFWLPFQNIISNNHIAQWTERVIVVQ